MAIKRNFTGGSGSDFSEGEHKVKIVDLKLGPSSTGKKMLTVTFENDEGATVKGFYVLDNKVAIIKIKELKVACGLAPDADGMLLEGKRLGIAVEKGKPDDKGKFYWQIVGYGKESDVEVNASHNDEAPHPATQPDQEIPF